MTQTALITGSSGLIGSAVAFALDARGWNTVGVDNNMRRVLFGPDGDTLPTLSSMKDNLRRFRHIDADIRDRGAMDALLEDVQPSLIVHAAAQPSHDLADHLPFEDFDINAGGTLNLLEAARRHCPESPFVFLSTNKVYGDAPNRIPLRELDTRYDYADSGVEGIDEHCAVDGVRHTLMGTSKLAADMLVQEYGRAFRMPTVCFRCGCLTGSAQAGAERHGFLSYMAKAVRERRTYRIFGYHGKQVRDNLHASDVCAAVMAFAADPRIAAVYNLGGGRANSISVIEALERFGSAFGVPARTAYVDTPRGGDHLCYISDTRRFRADYPAWRVTVGLDAIIEDFARATPALAAC